MLQCRKRKSADMKILVIDDEKRLANALAELLREQNHVADVVYDGKEGLYSAKGGNYDLILLDVMMPGMDGFEAVKQMREAKVSAPVLMLTAKDDVASKVMGLDCGADDYLTKPFDKTELFARINALARRQQKLAFDEIALEDVSLNASDYTATCGEKSVTLSAKEYSILKILLTNYGQIISKDVLISKVWGFDSDVTENNIEVYISFLRKKLAFIGSKLTIVAKRMLGYYLEKKN